MLAIASVLPMKWPLNLYFGSQTDLEGAIVAKRHILMSLQKTLVLVFRTLGGGAMGDREVWGSFVKSAISTAVEQ